MPTLPPVVTAGLLLVSLGLTTYEKLKQTLTAEGEDEATLAALDEEYTRRLARRG